MDPLSLIISQFRLISQLQALNKQGGQRLKKDAGLLLLSLLPNTAEVQQGWGAQDPEVSSLLL